MMTASAITTVEGGATLTTRSTNRLKNDYPLHVIIGFVALLLRPLEATTLPDDTNLFSRNANNCSQASLLLGTGCIAYDLQPSIDVRWAHETSIITIVQVTPYDDCANHRDGAPTAIKKLNEENDGRGFAIGYEKDRFIKFRLFSVLAGDVSMVGPDVYSKQHTNILRSLLEQHQPQYILGTCTYWAHLERDLALEYQTILLAQVGPPSFYTEKRNPYLFGFHLNSDNYPLSAIDALRFYADLDLPQGPSDQPVRIIYRTESEFFRSTCENAEKELLHRGFTDVETYKYDPTYDSDHNGISNAEDEDFLKQIADDACPPSDDGEDESTTHPAIFVCTATEQDTLLQRWIENRCQPTTIWMTASNQAWAQESLDVIPYFLGGSQWHSSFNYSDNFFSDGSEFLLYQETIFGYQGTYDMVVSYSIVTLIGAHLEEHYRAITSPWVLEDLSSEDGYESLRRRLLVLETTTLFGPFMLAVDSDTQQNIGRDIAGTQWLIDANKTENMCVAPLELAETFIRMPSPAIVPCEPGSYLSLLSMQNESSILSSKCEFCPVNTYLPSAAAGNTTCIPCPADTTTEGKEGATFCVDIEESNLSRQLVAFSLVAVCLLWAIAVAMLSWAFRRRETEIVKTSLCYVVAVVVGAIISSFTVITLSFYVGGSTSTADIGCKISPFLYCIGWVLQLGSVAGLAYPISDHPLLEYVDVYVEPRSAFTIYCGLILDVIVLSLWTVFDPVRYTSWIVSQDVDAETGVVTVEKTGFCSVGNELPAYCFLLPLGVIHFGILMRTYQLYWCNRNVGDTFNQRLHCVYAAAFANQLLVLAVPVLVVVRGSATARFAVMCTTILLNDLGVSSIVFFSVRNRRHSSDDYKESISLSSKASKKRRKTKKKELQIAKEKYREELSQSGHSIPWSRNRSSSISLGWMSAHGSSSSLGDASPKAIDNYDCSLTPRKMTIQFIE